jgi:ferric-dicitrate binding protein FerR (iron transport regulator)
MKANDSCEHVKENLWRYIDRELSAPLLAEISGHLKACSECSRLYEARARDAKLYRMAFHGSPFGEGFLERFHKQSGALPPLESSSPAGDPLSGDAPSAERLEGPLGGSAHESRVFARGEMDGEGWRSLPRARIFPGLRRYLRRGALGNPRRLVARIALAAALLIMGCLVLLGIAPGPALGTVESAGDVAMLRGQKSFFWRERELRAGDGFRLPPGSQIKVRLNDSSELVVLGPGEFKVDPASEARGPFLGRLDEGTLKAVVEPRLAHRELRISSPDATAVVVGTRFTLRVERGRRTVLEVTQGKVEFRADLRQSYVPVTAETGPYQVVSREGRVQPFTTEEGPAAARVPPSTGPEPADAESGSEPEKGGDSRPARPAPRSPATDLPVTVPPAGRGAH